MTARLQAVHRLPDLEHRNLTKEKAPQGAFFGGGWGGIRTHETLARLLVFKTSAFNRSATHPFRSLLPC